MEDYMQHGVRASPPTSGTIGCNPLANKWKVGEVSLSSASI